jgi:serine/threonine protein kinase
MAEASRKEVLAGRYQLESLVAHGGMGAVHLATDLRLERPVAIKVVNAHARNAETHARFVREAQRTAQIRHPNVVEVFDVGETETGDLFFVMELLKGEPLSTRLAREKRMALGTFFSVARQICEGLGAAHAVGIIHRDVKPANVMLVEHGSRCDHVKILDFGIAKAQSSGTALTEAGMFLGTLEYIAPEQILGETALDAGADVYALGALFYRMLTGSALFPDVSRAALIHHHLEVHPERPERRCPQAAIPRAVSDLVMRCLSKEPRERFATANELGATLQAVEGTLSKELLVDAPPESFVAARPLERPPTSSTRPVALPELEGAFTARMARFDPADPFETTTRDPVPVFEELELELATPPRSEDFGRPSPGPTCSACHQVLPQGAEACPRCGAFRPSFGVHSLRPRPMMVDPSGPPPWLAPFGILPWWVSAFVGIVALLGLGALLFLDVSLSQPYWGFGMVVLLSGIAVFVRRKLDAEHHP